MAPLRESLCKNPTKTTVQVSSGEWVKLNPRNKACTAQRECCSFARHAGTSADLGTKPPAPKVEKLRIEKTRISTAVVDGPPLSFKPSGVSDGGTNINLTTKPPARKTQVSIPESSEQPTLNAQKSTGFVSYSAALQVNLEGCGPLHRSPSRGASMLTKQASDAGPESLETRRPQRLRKKNTLYANGDYQSTEGDEFDWRMYYPDMPYVPEILKVPDGSEGYVDVSGDVSQCPNQEQGDFLLGEILTLSPRMSSDSEDHDITWIAPRTRKSRKVASIMFQDQFSNIWPEKDQSLAAELRPHSPSLLAEKEARLLHNDVVAGPQTPEKLQSTHPLTSTDQPASTECDSTRERDLSTSHGALVKNRTSSISDDQYALQDACGSCAPKAVSSVDEEIADGGALTTDKQKISAPTNQDIQQTDEQLPEVLENKKVKVRKRKYTPKVKAEKPKVAKAPRQTKTPKRKAKTSQYVDTGCLVGEQPESRGQDPTIHKAKKKARNERGHADHNLTFPAEFSDHVYPPPCPTLLQLHKFMRKPRSEKRQKQSRATISSILRDSITDAVVPTLEGITQHTEVDSSSTGFSSAGPALAPEKVTIELQICPVSCFAGEVFEEIQVSDIPRGGGNQESRKNQTQSQFNFVQKDQRETRASTQMQCPCTDHGTGTSLVALSQLSLTNEDNLDDGQKSTTLSLPQKIQQTSSPLQMVHTETCENSSLLLYATDMRNLDDSMSSPTRAPSVPHLLQSCSMDSSASQDIYSVPVQSSTSPPLEEISKTPQGNMSLVLASEDLSFSMLSSSLLSPQMHVLDEIAPSSAKSVRRSLFRELADPAIIAPPTLALSDSHTNRILEQPVPFSQMNELQQEQFIWTLSKQAKYRKKPTALIKAMTISISKDQSPLMLSHITRLAFKVTEENYIPTYTDYAPVRTKTLPQLMDSSESPGAQDLQIVTYRDELKKIVMYQEPILRRRRVKYKPKVKLDFDTVRKFKLLMLKGGAVDNADQDEGKWEEERQEWRIRANHFNTVMRQIQGNRAFTKWGGSVLDSVGGAFLTQNVSDFLSSTAFMALRARFPARQQVAEGISTPAVEEEEQEPQPIEEPEPQLVEEEQESQPVEEEPETKLVEEDLPDPWPPRPTRNELKRQQMEDDQKYEEAFLKLVQDFSSINSDDDEIGINSSLTKIVEELMIKVDELYILSKEEKSSDLLLHPTGVDNQEKKASNLLLHPMVSNSKEEITAAVAVARLVVTENVGKTFLEDTSQGSGEPQEDTTLKLLPTKRTTRSQSRVSGESLESMDILAPVYLARKRRLSLKSANSELVDVDRCISSITISIKQEVLQNNPRELGVLLASESLLIPCGKITKQEVGIADITETGEPQNNMEVATYEKDFVQHSLLQVDTCGSTLRMTSMVASHGEVARETEPEMERRDETLAVMQNVDDSVADSQKPVSILDDILIHSRSIEEIISLFFLEKAPHLNLVEDGVSQSTSSDSIIENSTHNIVAVAPSGELPQVSLVEERVPQNSTVTSHIEDSTNRHLPFSLAENMLQVDLVEEEVADKLSDVLQIDDCMEETLPCIQENLLQVECMEGVACNPFVKAPSNDAGLGQYIAENVVPVTSWEGNLSVIQKKFEDIVDEDLSNLTVAGREKILSATLRFILGKKRTSREAETEQLKPLGVDRLRPGRRKIRSKINNYRYMNKVSFRHLSGSERASWEAAYVMKSQKEKWEPLRAQILADENYARDPLTHDCVDWDAVRCASVHDVADVIKDRGQQNVLAGRMKAFLDRIYRDQNGSLDLEWIRKLPPMDAKDFLLSFRGLGLKSVECIRLLTLHHPSFPVDTNVGRIAVRLGWVPLEPLPEETQLHLLEMYPIQASIQQYLWPRLCTLDQQTLYELHYQMITFGKVFCTKSKPNCNACPMRSECKHFASSYASAKLLLKGPEKPAERSPVLALPGAPQPEEPRTGSLMETRAPRETCIPIIEEPCTPEFEVEVHDIEDFPFLVEFNTPDLEQPTLISNLTDQLAVEQNSMTRAVAVKKIVLPDLNNDPGMPIPGTNLTPLDGIDLLAQVVNLEGPRKIDSNMEPVSDNREVTISSTKSIFEDLPEETVSHILVESHIPSRELILLPPQAAFSPVPQLKSIQHTRTVHYVYELPDNHPLLAEMDKREADDPCFYLLAIWSPDEVPRKVPKINDDEASNPFASFQYCEEEETVRGTLLVPCRTAMRGCFPLNGTYFQVNEVFADHASSVQPIDVPRALLWSLRRRFVYFGTNVTNMFKGMSQEEIQCCFQKGHVCVRAFDHTTRQPKLLATRLHQSGAKIVTAPAVRKGRKPKVIKTNIDHAQIISQAHTNETPSLKMTLS